MSKAGFIAIVGRPNSGKSTLLNFILGAKVSIVTPKAQTTREKVLGILTEPDKGQLIFVDTPGIHRAKPGGINEYMVQEAKEALEAPNAIWYLVDPSSGAEHEKPVLELIQGTEAPVFLLLNKCDLAGNRIPEERFQRLEKDVLAALLENGIQPRASRRISARGGEGVQGLLEESWSLLPESPPYYPDSEQISDRPARFFVAEKVREQLLLQLGEEVPYSCAVQIEKFDESSRPPRIEAVIHVERDSQKGIVIGKGGKKIKEIGTAARKEIEEFFGYPVFLGLKVKVLKEWTRDPEALRRLGYNLPQAAAQKKKAAR